MLGAIREITTEHSVMVAAQNCPVPTFGNAIQQSLDDGAAIGSSVRIIPEKDDMSVCTTIDFYKAKCVFELVDLAVNIANSVNHDVSRTCGKPSS